MSQDETIIHMSNLMMRYKTGKVALSGLNMDIPKGSFVYLVGASGAGKSTLLRMLYGGLRPTSGQLEVQGTSMRGATDGQVRELRQRIGIIFQGNRLLN
ncbi:MAG: ATP-binding cassette domain-containing protein, partial [Ghiorsea sp.]|nr:ATP-binding cassette domain-containing protein [Ghiorsea sp.]